MPFTQEEERWCVVSSDCHLNCFTFAALNLEQRHGKKSSTKEKRAGGHSDDVIVTHFIGSLILVFMQDGTIPICSIRLCVCVEIWMEYNS